MNRDLPWEANLRRLPLRQWPKDPDARMSMRQSVRWVLTAAVVTTLASRLVHASEYWVGLRGVDRQQGGAQTSPWASLQFAADHVKAGDIVHVFDGDYVGFDLRTAGNEASP